MCLTHVSRSPTTADDPEPRERGPPVTGGHSRTLANRIPLLHPLLHKRARAANARRTEPLITYLMRPREMTQVPTQPLSPAEHYAAAERLVAAAESSITEEIQTASALIALTPAILTLSPRKARRVERPGRHASNGLPAHLTWGDRSE